MPRIIFVASQIKSKKHFRILEFEDRAHAELLQYFKKFKDTQNEDVVYLPKIIEFSPTVFSYFIEFSQYWIPNRVPKNIRRSF